MSVEKPPTTDVALSSYLLRALGALNSTVEQAKTFIVSEAVRNPTKGKFYLVSNAALPQFPAPGMYYYDGAAFVLLTGSTGGGTAVLHNSLGGLQGGATGDYQHLTTAQLALLTFEEADLRSTISGYVSLKAL